MTKSTEKLNQELKLIWFNFTKSTGAKKQWIEKIKLT